jgi:hypothetical protein
VYTDNVSNQEVFQILFPQFVREGKYEESVHGWWKKNVSPVIQVSQHDISIQLTCFYTLVQDLRCLQW